ncbi:hypothetical protein XENOCAPTIV_003935 [Xenoophorus captivus]|uniref:Uncharacterized protein n=1 Tax=Xenoophorus captivus TaxID=1517983 RepID=A0ABV0SD78_9TELE
MSPFCIVLIQPNSNTMTDDHPLSKEKRNVVLVFYNPTFKSDSGPNEKGQPSFINCVTFRYVTHCHYDTECFQTLSCKAPMHRLKLDPSDLQYIKQNKED